MVREIIKIVRSKRLWFAVSLMVWTYLVAWVFNHYYFQSPVKEWRCFMCERTTDKDIKSATVSASMRAVPTVMVLEPEKTEKDIIMSMPHGEQLWKIYFLESTHGSKDGCRINNEGWGGFGVKDGNEVVCYESFQKAVERAEYWWARLNPDEDLEGALCQWNTGKRQPQCVYSMTYMAL